MFDYCRRALGYSESASNRRINTARCMSRFPEVYELLLEGEVSLTTVSLVASILKPENKTDLLATIRGKSGDDVRKIVSQYRPQSYVRDRVRPVAKTKTPRRESSDEPLWSAESKAPPSNGESDDKKWQETYRRGGGNKVDTAVNSVDSCDTNSGEPANLTREIEQFFELKFAIDSEGMDMLEEIKVLLSTKHYRGVKLGELMKTVMAYYLDGHSPKRKKERREQRQAKAKEKASAKGTKKREENLQEPQNDKKRIPSRDIPAAVRDEVFVRDGGRCTCVGPDGVRCDSSWSVQHDHIVPWALGGDHSVDNLRLLCPTHNQLAADQAFGREFMHRRRSGVGREPQDPAGASAGD